MRVVIPAAGEGRRFQEAGYDKPKLLVDVAGQPMIQRVIDNVTPPGWAVSLIVRKDHEVLPTEGIELVTLDAPTQGAVETILKAPIDESKLLIANCDQICAFNVTDFVNTDLDGALVTFQSHNPAHSYVATDDKGIITKIAEKDVISSRAVAGIYYFKNGKDFVSAAQKVIDDNIKTKGEYYTSSVVAELIAQGKRLGVMEAPTLILGTPEDLQRFEVGLYIKEHVLG